MPGWAMVDSGNRVPSQEWPGQESNAQLELSADTTYFSTELVWGLAEATRGGVLTNRPSLWLLPRDHRKFRPGCPRCQESCLSNVGRGGARRVLRSRSHSAVSRWLR